jgi:hypothetical protein
MVFWQSPPLWHDDGRSMFSAVTAGMGRFWTKGVAKWRHPGPLVAVLVVSFGMASCALSPVGDGSGAAATPEARREAVTMRVNERWNALIKGDLDAAYALLSPASRETLTLDQFKRKTAKGRFREAKIVAVDCGAELCTVKLWITYDHRMMKGVETPMEETWVFDRGQPWLVYRG